MMQNSLFLELVSNASMNVYPENKLNSFQNHLPGAINLDGDWEIGLVEISFPSKVYNVDQG